MTNVKLPGVSSFTDRLGKRRWRFRRKGFATVMLPGHPGEARFLAAYQAALETGPATVGANRTIPGSLSDALVRYYASPEWRLLAPASQRARRAILESVRAAHGDKPLAKLERRHVMAMLDAKAATPFASNNLLKALKGLLRFAHERQMIKANPAEPLKARRIKTDGFKVWTEDEIAAFEAFYPLGTKPRLAMTLLLHTGQRRSDVVRMGRQHLRDGFIEVRQSKTGTTLHLPITPELQAAIDAAPRTQMTFLETEFGRPYSAAFFGNKFREWCDAAGLKSCSAHGLRKAAATRLANAGLSAHVIASITGHKSLSEVALYTRAAEQKKLASTARDALRGRTETEHEVGKPDAPPGKLAGKSLK